MVSIYYIPEELYQTIIINSLKLLIFCFGGEEGKAKQTIIRATKNHPLPQADVKKAALADSSFDHKSLKYYNYSYSPTERYLSPVSGSMTTILFPLFSGLLAI